MGYDIVDLFNSGMSIKDISKVSNLSIYKVRQAITGSFKKPYVPNNYRELQLISFGTEKKIKKIKKKGQKMIKINKKIALYG